MVNVVNDPRFQMARLMRQQAQNTTTSNGYGGSVLPSAPSSASVSLGRAATSLSISNPTLRQQIDAIAQGKKAAEPKGALGAVLNNPITKTTLGALNVLSIPGRAVVAGAREVVDKLDSDPTTKASFSDFTKNVKDPMYGFGKAFKIDTGNIWLDRAIGFAGDMVTDPLNYVTFGGAKFAGYAGRLDLSKNVLKLTGDVALANKVQRYGRAAIKDAEMLEMLGANRHGLYFLGKRMKVGKNGQGLRLPGSGAIGMLGDNALSKLRVSASKTKAGQWIQKMTLDSDNLAARQALLQGRVSDDAAAALVSYFTADPIQRAAAGEVLATEQRRVLNILENEKAKGLDGWKAQLPDLIESDDLFNAASPELQRAAQVWRDLFGGYEDSIMTILKEIDPTIDPATRFRANYFPRMLSEDGLNYIGDASKTHSGGLRAIFARDPLAGGRNFKARTLEVGDDFFGYKLKEADLKSTSRLNEIAREAGFNGDFFETDISKVLNRYVDEYAKEMGVLARHKHLAETGFWKRAESVTVTGEFIDQEMIDSIKKTVKTLDDDMGDLARQTSEAVSSLRTNIEEMRKSLSQSLEAAKKELDSAEQLGDLQDALNAVMRGDVHLTADKLELVAANLGQWKKRFAEMFGAEYKNGKLVAKAGNGVDDTPLAADGILGYLDTLESDMLRLNDEIVAMTVNKTGKELDDAVKMATEAIDGVVRRMEAAQERLQVVMQFGNALEAGLESMARGVASFTGPQQVHDVLAILARNGAVTTDTVERVINEQFNVAGQLQDFLSKWVNAPGSIFDDVTMHAGLNRTDVSKFTPSDLYNVLNNSYNTNLDPNELRIAALFSLAHDERIYGSAIPEPIQKMRYKLIERLRRIDEAMAYEEAERAALQRGNRRSARKIWETQVEVDYERATGYQEELVELQKFIDEYEKIVLSNPDSATLAIDIERLSEAVGNKYPKVQALLGDFGEDWEDLMGMNMPINTRAANVEYMADVPDPTYFAGRGRAEGGAGFEVKSLKFAGVLDVDNVRASAVSDMTIAELLDTVKERVGRINSYMDEPVFEYGVGASAKRYTGRELVQRYDDYVRLKDELANVRRIRSEFEEDIRTQLGMYDIDVKDPNLSPDELATRQRKIDQIKTQASVDANGREYDDAFIIMLRNAGYFKIAKDDVDFVSKRRAAYIQAESEYLQIKEARPTTAPGVKGPGAVVAGKRQGRVTYGDKYTQLRDQISEIAGGEQNLRPKAFSNIEAEKRALAADLTDYAMVSEIHSRFNAVASILGGFGLVPTRRMFGEVIDTVNQKFVPRLTTKISSLNQSYGILQEMDVEISRRLANNTAGLTPAQIFSDVLNGLTPAQRGKLEETIGNQINWTSDPYDLRVGIANARAGKSTRSSGSMRNADGTIKTDKNGKAIPMPSEQTLAENEYIDTVVRPWWESAYPGKPWPGKKAVKAKLRELSPSRAKGASSTVSAFAEGAEPAVIRDWFVSLIGKSEIRGRNLNNVVTSDGPLLERRLRELRMAEKRYRQMLLPDLDIAKFFDDPSLAQKTPTWYAYLLNDHADRLEAAINVKRAKNVEVVRARTTVGELEADVVGKQAEYERMRNAPALVEQLTFERNSLVDRRTGLNNKKAMAGIELTPAEKRELAGLDKKIDEANAKLAAANRLPKNTQENISAAERRAAKIREATKPRLVLETELGELTQEGKALSNKSRSKRGLTQREQSRLNAIKKRVAKIKEELAKPLVDEDGNVLRTTPRDLEVAQVVKADRNVTAANRIIDEYNALIASPSHAKAMDDQAMIDALVALSGFDLHKFEDGFIVVREQKGNLPDGTYGVVTPAEYAVMPNGQRIVFSEAEWNSLYRRPHSEQELQLMRSELRQLEKNIIADTESASAEIAGLQSRIDAYSKLSYEQQRKWYAYRLEFERQLNAAQARIKSNGETLANIKMRQQSLLKGTQESALMKMKILVHGSQPKAGRTASRPAFDTEGLSRFKSFEHPSQSIYSTSARSELVSEGTTSAEVLSGTKEVASTYRVTRAMSSETGMVKAGIVVDNGTATQRAERLQNIWNTTDEKKLLDKAEKMRTNLFVRMDANMRNDILAGQSVVDSARAEVARVIRETNGLGGEVDKARQGAQDLAVTADILTEQRTGLPAGTRLDASYVDDSGTTVYRSSNERIDPGLTRAVDDDGVPFVTAENLRSPDDFREFSELVVENNRSTGPFAVRADEAQSNVNLQRVAESFDSRIEAAKKNLDELRTTGGTSKQITTAENKIQKLRDAKEEALIYARGEQGAVDEYLAVQEKFSIVPGVRNEQGGPVYAPVQEVKAYNAAKQTAEEWAKENKAALELAKKQWQGKSVLFENAEIVMRETTRLSETNLAEINRRFGGFDGYFEYVNNQRNLVESLQTQLKDIENITKMPPKSAADVLIAAAGKGKRPPQKKIDEAINQYRMWLRENKTVLEQFGAEPNNPVYKAWAAAAQADADLIWLDFTKRQQLEQLVLAQTPVWREVVVQPFAKEWEKAAKASGLYDGMAAGGKRGKEGKSSGFPGLMGNKEALDLLDNIARIREPGVVDDLSRFMSGYTGFFRAYATLSPGFHVRNTISNVFSLFAAGADVANMREGFKMWRLFDDAIKNGKSVDEFIASLPVEKQEFVRISARTVLGLGGGRVDNALEGFVRGGNKLTSNGMLDFSRQAGHNLEGSARFMLAYDSAVKGFNFEESFNRTGRFLIDYNKRTLLDDNMRDIVPFWMWMSRNLPLQIVNRWANPKPYLTWQKVQKNFSQEPQEGEVTPQYLSTMGAIGLGGGKYFNPDLPFTRVNEQVQDLANPRKLMSYVNPGIRAPLEFLMNSNTYTGQPFSGKMKKVDGALGPFLPLLQATGQVTYDGQGNPVVSDRAYSLLMNMIPPLGRAERLFPAEGTGNAGNALAGFVGLPFTNVNQDMQDREKLRRMFAMQELAKQQQNIQEAQ